MMVFIKNNYNGYLQNIIIEVVMGFDGFLIKTFIKNNDRGFYKFIMKVL
jgi:hypothetical protein